MAFDLKDLTQAIASHQRVARIVITDVKGSTPREACTSMLVWQDGQSGTIGGGTLEFQAVIAARASLSGDGMWRRATETFPLGPALGQCCGGSVSLLTEVFSRHEIVTLQNLETQSRPFNRSRISGHPPDIGKPFISEAFKSEDLPLWVYGAGHVGRALVNILPGLGYAVTWVDTADDRFPAIMPDNVEKLVAANPATVVQFAPINAEHLIVTYSHKIDLEICHKILSHSFVFAGLIGSATKWARFRTRLASLGHNPAQIARITCPIGLPELGKAPEAIAVGVATALLREAALGQTSATQKEHAI